MEVKDIIRTRRIELGYTLKEIAEMCDVSEATVSRWETGDIENMRRNRIARLATALKVSPSVIMGWEEPPKKELRLTDHEKHLINAYRDSDETTQSIINKILSLEVI